MNKQTFATILEVALLHFDGVSDNEMILNYNLNPKLVEIGIKLSNYLKGIKIK